ncbi:hypothetical protein [Pedobacter sp. Leaf176]|uniref:hypothetical protein n=1 Tax=Pedobacter sp. Leaf176 TaxID=1736286 RepID=UPI0006F8E35E|nr:hypothetical protein [Pedobacter sp. Leaf176]KQR67639.1 hypothetical protein ASF92_18350 [Pedobacter sp. Leaf176]
MFKNFVLLSYGSDVEYRRAIFCIFSFLSWKPDLKNIRFVIYTDYPEAFKIHLSSLNVQYILLTPELEEQLLNGTTFHHLIKVGVIDLTFKKYPGEHLFFVDTDTFFIANPSNILNSFARGKSFLHKREYRLGDAVSEFAVFNQEHFPLSFMRFISGRVLKINNKTVKFDENDYSWNTGVLALNNEFSSYMADVKDLTYQFYENSKWFVSEQLAFSLVLQKVTLIRPADDVVFHYWGRRQKVFMDNYLDELFRLNSSNKLDLGNTKLALKQLQKMLSNDIILEQINIAIRKKDYPYLIKQSLKIILKNPFSSNIFKQIYKELS